jgi:hypothetical protein
MQGHADLSMMGDGGVFDDGHAHRHLLVLWPYQCTLRNRLQGGQNALALWPIP